MMMMPDANSPNDRLRMRKWVICNGTFLMLKWQGNLYTTFGNSVHCRQDSLSPDELFGQGNNPAKKLTGGKRPKKGPKALANAYALSLTPAGKVKCWSSADLSSAFSHPVILLFVWLLKSFLHHVGTDTRKGLNLGQNLSRVLFAGQNSSANKSILHRECTASIVQWVSICGRKENSVPVLNRSEGCKTNLTLFGTV